MKVKSPKKSILGRVERIDFPTLGIANVPAKVDTGADVSSIWCSQSIVVDKQLNCIFFGKGSRYYTGKVHKFPRPEYTVTRVANSFGHKEVRFKIKLPLKIDGRTITATFTLADRSNKLYPVLVGNSTLRHKFVVDPSRGKPLTRAETERRRKLSAEMANFMEEVD